LRDGFDADYGSQMGAAESLLVAEQRMLQMIAGGTSLTEPCGTIDVQAPSATSILRMDPDGKRS